MLKYKLFLHYHNTIITVTNITITTITIGIGATCQVFLHKVSWFLMAACIFTVYTAEYLERPTNEQSYAKLAVWLVHLVVFSAYLEMLVLRSYQVHMLRASLTSLPALISLKCLDVLCKFQFNANVNIVSGMSSASLASLPAPSPSPSSSSSSTTTPIQVGQTPFFPFFLPLFHHPHLKSLLELHCQIYLFQTQTCCFLLLLTFCSLFLPLSHFRHLKSFLELHCQIYLFHIFLTFSSSLPRPTTSQLHCSVRFIFFRPRREAGFRGRRVKLMTL